jgi:hypothetical protein
MNDKLLFDRVKEEMNIWSTYRGFGDPVGFLYKLVQKYNGPFDSIDYDELKQYAEFLHVSLLYHPSQINDLTHQVIAMYDLSLHKRTILRRFWDFITCQ